MCGIAYGIFCLGMVFPFVLIFSYYIRPVSKLEFISVISVE